MNQSDFNAFCKSLPQTTHVVQWGNADVWKVGGKLFAVGGWNKDTDQFAVTFKVTDMGFEILPEMPGVRPAPYLASRGMKWVQHYDLPGLSDTELRNHITASYEMIRDKLTKKLKRELGFDT
ncbi:MAG: MmcQ/YjbR family DNA-binding protein [Pikeienuella sp.]